MLDLSILYCGFVVSPTLLFSGCILLQPCPHKAGKIFPFFIENKIYYKILSSGDVV